MNYIYIIYFKINHILNEKYTSYFLRLIKVLNKKYGHNESHDLSIKHNKQNNIVIKVREVMWYIYCEAFDNTVNDDIQ